MKEAPSSRDSPTDWTAAVGGAVAGASGETRQAGDEGSERIDRILQEKRELFDTIFSGTEALRKLGLTQQELFGLFDLKCPGGPFKFAA